jgi:hypothetical protein
MTDYKASSPGHSILKHRFTGSITLNHSIPSVYGIDKDLSQRKKHAGSKGKE